MTEAKVLLRTKRDFRRYVGRKAYMTANHLTVDFGCLLTPKNPRRTPKGRNHVKVGTKINLFHNSISKPYKKTLTRIYIYIYIYIYIL